MKVVKAKSDKLLYVRAREGFSQQRFHISKHSLDLSYTWILSSPSSSCCLHAEFSYFFLPFITKTVLVCCTITNTYSMEGAFTFPSCFSLFQKVHISLKKPPTFLEKSPTFLEKLPTFFRKSPTFFPKHWTFSQAKRSEPKTLNGTQTATDLHDDRKIPQKKETFTWSSIRLSLHLQQHSHLKTFRQWILTK